MLEENLPLLPGEAGPDPDLPGLPGDSGPEAYLAGDVGVGPTAMDLLGPEDSGPWTGSSFDVPASQEPETVSWAEAEAVLERITRPGLAIRAPARPPRPPRATVSPLTPTRGGRARVWPWLLAASCALGLLGVGALLPGSVPTPAPGRAATPSGPDDRQRLLERLRFSEQRALEPY